MRIIFFLNCKKKYQLKNQILSNKNNKNINDIIEINKNELFIVKINETLKNMCRHHFVNDTIDIGIDCSKNIRYCSICEYTI